MSTPNNRTSFSFQLGIIVFASILWLTPHHSGAADTKPHSDTGLAWLHLIDQQQFDQSWDQASLFLKAHITKDHWAATLREKRLPLGHITARDKASSEFQYHIAGIGDGTFQVTVYRTHFGNQKILDETLILAKESDGQWRAIGYYLK
jgi:hypothetical protein